MAPYWFAFLFYSFIILLYFIIILGYAFLGALPDHWCSIDELKESNWTITEIKRISIPRKL